MSKRIKHMLIAATALCIVATVGLTLAFMFKKAEKINRFIPAEVACAVREKTDGSEVFVWRLKGKFAYPESEHNTKDDGTDSNGNTIVYNGISTQHKFTKNGGPAKAVNVAAEKYTQGEAKFFEQVQTPDTISAT